MAQDPLAQNSMRADMEAKKTLIMLPTYNEAENVANIHRQIREIRPTSDILFVDDHSPDGTGRIIDRLAEKDPGTIALHRPSKLGIGSAHKDGIDWAYDRKYEVLITMDCDLTHSPSYILDFIRESSQADIVVGSRYLKEDSLATWNLFRKSLTYIGHFLTKTLLDMPYDASGAFRLYHLPRIDRRVFGLVKSQGYSFFYESLYILHMNRLSIRETPIHLPARTYGTSKMTWSDAWNSLRFLLELFRRKVLDKRSLVLEASLLSDAQ